MNAVLARREKALALLAANHNREIKEGEATAKSAKSDDMVVLKGEKYRPTGSALLYKYIHVTPLKFTEKKPNFKFGADDRHLVFLGLSNLTNKDYNMVVAAETGWSFVSQNIDGIWMNFAQTKSVNTNKFKGSWQCKVLNATKTRSVVMVQNIGDENGKTTPFVARNAKENLDASIDNADDFRYDTGHTSLNVLGASIVTDYIEKHPVWDTKYITDVEDYYKDLEQFELPNMSVPLWPSTRVNWWFDPSDRDLVGPAQEYEDIVKASDGVVLEYAPIKFLADHEDNKEIDKADMAAMAAKGLAAMKNCVKWCRVRKKPVVWLAPKGGTDKYLETMKETWALFKTNACQPDAVVVINYEPGINNGFAFGPERNGTASTNTLTGVARWLLSGQ